METFGAFQSEVPHRSWRLETSPASKFVELGLDLNLDLSNEMTAAPGHPTIGLEVLPGTH